MATSDHIKALIRAGRSAEALAILSEALRKDPDSVDTWWLISFAVSDKQKQIFAVQRVLQLSPGNPNAERRLRQLDPMAGLATLRQAAQSPAPTRLQPAYQAPISRNVPESAAVIATPKARAWTLGLAAVFVVTIGTAFLLNSVNTASAAQEQRQLLAGQPIEDLDVAPATLPDIVVVLPTDTAEESLATTEPTLAPTDLATATPQALAELILPTAQPSPTATAEPTDDLPALDSFVASVANGQGSDRVGIFVENLFSYPILPQPANDPAWITSNFGEVTEFRIVRQHTGNEGLIAHNYLAGGEFYSLKVGDIAELVLGDGSVIEFEIYDIQQFQALSPNSPTSDFLDLATGDKLSASDLFYRVYGGNMTLTFQTCINRDNISTWGRTFIIGAEL
jgi:hypothetical protein